MHDEMTDDDDDSGFSSSFASPAIFGGVILLLFSLVCLGTWPALLRLCTYYEEYSPTSASSSSQVDSPLAGVRRALARRRHPCHAYIDYAAAYVLFSLTVPILISKSIRNLGDGEEDALADSSEGDSALRSVPLILVAMLGGSLLAVGNMTTQWSTTVYRAPLTTVLAVQASLCVIVGTSLNYLLEPGKTARPDLLACGVGSFLVAIVLSMRAQRSYDLWKDGSKDLDEDGLDEVGISMHALGSTSGEYLACRSDGELCRRVDDLWREDGAADTPASEHQMDETKNDDNIIPRHAESDSVRGSISKTGMTVALVGGLCFGFFSPAFNIAVNDPFGVSNFGSGLSVAAANACFAVAFAANSVLWNLFLMWRPPPGACPPIPPSKLHEYLNSSCADRVMALSAGVVCALGNVLQFQGESMAGFAAADLVQAFPLVAMAWDVCLFGEFRGAPTEVAWKWHLRLTYISYVAGIVLLALSIRG